MGISQNTEIKVLLRIVWLLVAIITVPIWVIPYAIKKADRELDIF